MDLRKQEKFSTFPIIRKKHETKQAASSIVPLQNIITKHSHYGSNETRGPVPLGGPKNSRQNKTIPLHRHSTILLLNFCFMRHATYNCRRKTLEDCNHKAIPCGDRRGNGCLRPLSETESRQLHTAETASCICI